MFKPILTVVFLFVHGLVTKAQIGNYVTNGSFEECVNCDSIPYLTQPKAWTGADSTYAFIYCGLNAPLSNLPYFANGYQFPRSGNYAIAATIYCDLNTCWYNNSRNYPRNRLKKTLKANTAYCVKFYVVNVNYNTVAIDAFGAYFGDQTVDTIHNCRSPLTFLNPQIQNATGNIIKDTMNWTLITGTFTANGTEKYMVLGNFKSNAATNTLFINPAELPALATDIFFDDVSVIELNLPAYAGPDQFMTPGDSVFIGREPDFAIDSGCTWYQLPNMTTPLKKISGMWVKPATTTTYVVRQVLDCSSEKWDTVVVYMNIVGLERIQALTQNLQVYPVPAKNFIQLQAQNMALVEGFNRISIHNNLGMLLREEELHFENSKFILKVEDLPDGVYSVQLKSVSVRTVSKRFVIAR